MYVNHLNEHIMRLTRLDHQTLVCIRDETVSVSSYNGQSHGSKDAVGVDTKFMPAHAGSGPASVVQEHLQGDVVTIKAPVQRHRFEFVAVGIKEGWIEVQQPVGWDATPFAFKGDERQTAGLDLERKVGCKHGTRSVVEPIPVKLPRPRRLCLDQGIRGVFCEFSSCAHAHGDVAVDHPAVALDIFCHELQDHLLTC